MRRLSGRPLIAAAAFLTAGLFAPLLVQAEVGQQDKAKEKSKVEEGKTVGKLGEDRDAVLTRWAELLAAGGIAPQQAAFPLEARRRILKVLEVIGRGPRSKPTGCVIAGFLYRDTDQNGKCSPGESLSATLLGLPTLEGSEASANGYFNCYWFGPVDAGRPYKLRYQPDGVAPVLLEVAPKVGLNIVPVPIKPTKPLVYILPHSHFDPEWMKTYEGYLSSEVPNVRWRLDLLQSDPAHCFYNDEECVTRPLIERSEPKYKEMLRQGISDGAIEPKGLVCQNELTMPYGESMIRAMTHGEQLLSELVGAKIRPQVFSSIDQYGINFQLPQILCKAGRKYFLNGEYAGDHWKSRIPYSDPDVRKQSAFWLQGLDGSKVLVHRSGYCSGYMGPMVHTNPGRTPSLVPGPVNSSAFGPHYRPVLSHNSVFRFQGHDFCGPDVKLSSRIRQWNAQNGDCKYIISLAPSFFRAIEQYPELPTYTAESFVTYWNGVYESRVKGRQQNRHVENKILAAEALATAAGIAGMPYPKGEIDQGWYLLLINHHHDPQMTPMGPGLFDDVLARYDRAEGEVDAALDATLIWLTNNIRTDEQSGKPVVVFNCFAWSRSPIIEVEVPGELSSVRVIDPHGVPVAAQVVKKAGGKTTVALLAKDLPALGWRTYYVSDAAAESSAPAVAASKTHIENEHLRIELKDGMIHRVVEKRSGATVLQADSSAGVNEILIWKDQGCISIIKPVDSKNIVDFIGNPNAELMARSSNASKRQVSVIESGPVRGLVQVS